MNRLLKILLVLTILLSLFAVITSVYATENEPTTVSEEVIDGTESSTLSSLSPSTITSVNQLNNYSQANLELNNILNVILISLCVLLILLAIAILVKFKK